jgi:hypothetical protein
LKTEKPQDIETTRFIRDVILLIYIISLTIANVNTISIRIDIYSEVCYDDIKRFISQSADLRPIWSAYRELKYQSERARYLVAHFQPDEVRKLEGKLGQVETHIQGLLE